MIDIRDVSYTQGSPLTPVHEGEIVIASPLMPTKPPIDVSHVSVEPIDTTPAIPQVVTDFLTQAPIVSQVGLITDLWGLLLGSPEQKAETVLPYLPITPQAETQIQEQVIAPMVASGDWATTPTLPTGQTFEIPDILGMLGEAGKWVLIGGAALLGLYIVTRKK